MKWTTPQEELPTKGKPIIIYYYPRHPIMEGRTYTITRRTDPGKYTDEYGFPNVSSVTHWVYIEPPTTP